jgi:RecJ-like exonuclease
MSYGSMTVKTTKPIIAFGMTDEGEMKISGRGNYDLVRAGLKLGGGLNEASKEFGGEGGGHDVAAGAKIPPEKRDEFLKRMDEIVARQLKK